MIPYILEGLRNDDEQALYNYMSEDGKIDQIIKAYEIPADEDDILRNNIPLIAYAAFYGADQCFRTLISNGAETKFLDNFNRNLLHFAAAGGNDDIFSIVSDLDIDKFQRDKKSLSVIHYAAKYGRYSIVVKLWMDDYKNIKDNAIELKAQSGITPLHLACESGDIETIQFLIDQECDINALTTENLTPLHFACKNAEVMQLLIERGADFRKKDIYGRTAFELTMKKGDFESAKWVINKMIEEGEDCKQIYFAAAAGGNVDVFSAFIDKGIDINFENSDCETALHVAAKNGNVDLIKYMVEQGADPNWENNIGDSPLHVAAKNKQQAAAKALIECGANKNQKNNIGKTPLMIAESNGVPLVPEE